MDFDDGLYDVVRAAIRKNMSPEEFIKETGYTWGQVLEDEKISADRAFEKANKK